MEEKIFGTVFIGGSETVGTLPENALVWLDYFMEANEHFIIGDSSGVDLAIQNYLHSRGYKNVTVYCTADERRFNVGKWGAKQVALKPEQALIAECDCAFLIWDGSSEETKSSIEKLRKLGLPIFIYRTDLDRLRVVRRSSKLNNSETKKEKAV